MGVQEKRGPAVAAKTEVLLAGRSGACGAAGKQPAADFLRRCGLPGLSRLAGRGRRALRLRGACLRADDQSRASPGHPRIPGLGQPDDAACGAPVRALCEPRPRAPAETLWEGRFKGAPIDGEAYLLACSRHIERNPVRAGMVARPADYRWSSYRANALGEADPLLRPHPVYLALSDAPAARCGAYRALFRGQVDDRQLDAIRSALQTGTPLGDGRFRARIEHRLDAKVGHDRRGRPRAQSAPDSMRETRKKGIKGY